MEGANPKSKGFGKSVSIGLNILCALMILGAFQMIFDNNHLNDYLGGLFLLLFWMFLCLNHMIKDFLKGHQKSAYINLLFAIAAAAIIIWGFINHSYKILT
ncbi:hypothetical protein [Pseudalkalibacillus hwajinpoensis]|uniref:DUF4181 domain-containing protein n=1 Tax=Guptibacillus hwajinpoensis TaxID=208199 RepID=A0A4V5Q255_9BACL|nr:hypothetical protein [Pseudalkalibacillus hwajinpoensis]TKD72308.1 hypothetical protein FBF83_05840 [Pseudalkalibacillus hwajinpoensis]